MPTLTTYLTCLSLTVMIESIVSYSLGYRRLRQQAWICLANCLTNPPVVYLSTLAARSTHLLGWGLALVLLESSVIVIEAMIFTRCLGDSWTLAWRLAGINNLVSFGSGIVLALGRII